MRMALLFGGAFFVAAVMTPLASAQAQSFTWGGTGSTTTTTDYNLGTNWSSLPAGAPLIVDFMYQAPYLFCSPLGRWPGVRG